MRRYEIESAQRQKIPTPIWFYTVALCGWMREFHPWGWVVGVPSECIAVHCGFYWCVTRPSYVVFTPSGLLVSIDYGSVVQFVLLKRDSQFDLLMLDWQTVLIGYTPLSKVYISIWPMGTWFANAPRRREPPFVWLRLLEQKLGK